METMKRTAKQVIKEGLSLLWQDVRSLRIAFLLMAVYFFVMEVFLHNACPFVLVTGYPCPACGLTRAGLHLLQGEFAEAAKLNLFIYPIAALLVLFFLYRYVLRRKADMLVKLTIVLILLMVLYYIYRMCTQFPGEAPMTYYYGNLFRRIKEFVP